MLQCCVCEKPLSGTIDTFNLPGDLQNPLCAVDFHAGLAVLRGEQKTIEDWEYIERCEGELEAARTALSDARDDFKTAETT